MNEKMTQSEIEKRFAEINGREPEVPSSEDLAALAAAETENAADAVSLEEYIEQKEYSGKLLLRIPKDLHRDLAEAAKLNGVSLNQYAAYKLAR